MWCHRKRMTFPATIVTTGWSQSKLYGSRLYVIDDHRMRKFVSSRIRRCVVMAAGQLSPSSTWHTLPDGMRLEMISYGRTNTEISTRPPILFIHGSYHGAWCWEEKFMPYFADKGYESHAISLRAQGNSDRGELKYAGTLESHVNDLASVIGSLERPPIVVGHSFGGLLVEAYCSLSGVEQRPPVAGLALLASVPPSGNKDIIVRITKNSLLNSFKITWGFVTKSFARSKDSCRELFFSTTLPDEELVRFQEKLAECSPVGLLNVRELPSELPLPPLEKSIFAGDEVYKKVFVGGGLDDQVVDPPAVEELASYFDVKPKFWAGLAHDVMLDTKWKVVAEDLEKWISECF